MRTEDPSLQPCALYPIPFFSRTPMETIRLEVTGMSCGHCQSAVQNALRRQRGVRAATVDLEGGTAQVEYDPSAITPEQLTAAVAEEGYTATVA
jgi:copper chaperone